MTGPLRAERRSREARHEIFTTPGLVTARRSILGPPAEGRPGPSSIKVSYLTQGMGKPARAGSRPHWARLDLGVQVDIALICYTSHLPKLHLNFRTDHWANAAWFSWGGVTYTVTPQLVIALHLYQLLSHKRYPGYMTLFGKKAKSNNITSRNS